MKRFAQNILVSILAWQTRRLRSKNDFKVVAVAGSIGKTSTKLAIAAVLGPNFRVRFQDGNYNHPITVPLVFFDLPLPSLYNPFAWTMTLLKIEYQLSQRYAYDVVVVELGTDFPGNLAEFKKYLHADIGVLTAITPEHMEFFKDLDTVAKEELTIAKLSQKLLVNLDLCDKKYIEKVKGIGYGVRRGADYQLAGMRRSPEGFDFMVSKQGTAFVAGTYDGVVQTQLFSMTAAVAVADMLGVDGPAILAAIAGIKPVSGRMQTLAGVKGSTILDDTYNASPEAARAALDTLYEIGAPQKIALLGNMNELGDYSPVAHEGLGAYCDPAKLDLVVTLGPDANEYLAAAAEEAGCTVIRTDTPLEAAIEIKKVLKDNALVLIKGSQNKVFAEETVKKLLANPTDASKLVRQSPDWIKKKQAWLGPLDD
nr:Mur ligase middle domain protein [uncultured bacterium]